MGKFLPSYLQIGDDGKIFFIISCDTKLWKIIFHIDELHEMMKKRIYYLKLNWVEKKKIRVWTAPRKAK